MNRQLSRSKARPGALGEYSVPVLGAAFERSAWVSSRVAAWVGIDFADAMSSHNRPAADAASSVHQPQAALEDAARDGHNGFAELTGRRLNGHELIKDVIAGVTFTDGEKQHAA